eukprot:scaffold14.g1159.t1
MLSRAAVLSARASWLARQRPPSAAVHRALHHGAAQQQQRFQSRGRQVVTASATAVDEPASTASSSAGGSFVELGVDPRLAATMPQQGIHTPTEVQLGAIPAVLGGGNVAMQCYTGSGKTLAYLLPVLTLAVARSQAEWEATTRKTRGEAGGVQAVVVAPSRELAMQIMRVAQSLLPESARRAVQQAIGGASMWRQRDALKLHKPLLVVGTPGRLAELSRDGSLQTHKCGILVLDEVDQLLAPQFREEMTRLTEHCGKKAAGGRQTIVVSATLTPRVLQHLHPWCPNPQTVFVGTPAAAAAPPLPLEEQGARGGPASTSGAGGEGLGAGADAPRPQWGWGLPQAPSADGSAYVAVSGSAGGFGNADLVPGMPPNLRHVYVACAPQHKVDTLRRCLHALGSQRALVFMNFQQRLKDTEAKLRARRMAVASLHGELSKQQRKATLDAFRRGDFRALVVSDVAARGLDIPEVDAVFHLELPSDAAHYAHRAGRTARAGRAGLVVSLVSGGERFVIDKLSRRLGVPIEEVEVSHGEAVVRPASSGRQQRGGGGGGESGDGSGDGGAP